MSGYPPAALWVAVKDGDPRALALRRGHYSVSNPDARQMLPPGQKMLLLSTDCLAVFGWVRNTMERYDRQTGVCCTIFRNTSPVLSSALVIGAEAWAWWRWPGERLFTYVNPAAVASPNPGYCFKCAGWRPAGRSKRGLILLEKDPQHL